MAKRNANSGARGRINRGNTTRRDTGGNRSNRKPGQEMSEHQVLGFLGRKILQAMNDEDGDLSDNREENFNYYTGQEYGNERDGYSKYVTRETLETIEQVLPSVLRVFLSGDQIVAFDPVSPDDEDAAKQETDVTNYYVMKKNKSGEGGFLTLHHWLKDALMNPVGYIKAYMEELEKTTVGTVTGLTAEGVQYIVADENIEILEQRSREESYIQQGVPTSIEVFDLKIRTTKNVMQLRIDPVPPEECLVDNDLTSLNLDDADFVCHRTQKSFSRLVNEGLDPDELNQVGQGENYQWNDERVNRLYYEDEDPDAGDEDDDSMRQFWVHECYAWFDYDGTGVAQHRRVLIIGDKVFDNEETDYQPFVALSSILMQHKHNGMSYIDIMKDLQLLLSTLTRQLLDSVYKANVGKQLISEDALTTDGSTMEALLNTQAEYVPVRGPAQMAMAPNPRQALAGELLPVIQHFTQARAMRTGVTPETAISANELQEVRQDVFMNAMEAASQRIEMLVRIIAETGMRWLMLKVHQLLRSHWDVETAVKLRGKWVNVDPTGWQDRTDMTVNVGLGFHTKHQLLGLLVQLLSMQKEAIAAGLATPEKIYNTLERIINAGGIGDVRMFFVDPNSPEYKPPEPQPDANMILAQAQAQALQQEQQRKQFEAQTSAQNQAQKVRADVASKAQDTQIKQTDQQIKLRDLALKEAEMVAEGKLREGEIAKQIAEIQNIHADTLVKMRQAGKTEADTLAVAVEASETYRAAMDVAEGGEDGADSDDESVTEDSGESGSGDS